MRLESEMILRVEHNHALRLAGGAAGVEDIGHVAEFGLAHTALHLTFMGAVAVTERQKLVEAQRKTVVLVALHLGVEDHDVFQLVAKTEHTPNGVILLLFAHENEANLGIVHHELHLGAARGGIKRHAHRTGAEGAELHEERFRLVLRKDRNAILHPHTEVNE